MRVVNKLLLQEFRDKQRCEWCGKTSKVEPHHVHTKGSGRLDIRQNLLALCRWCHDKLQESGKQGREAQLALIANREKTTVEEIIALVHRLRRSTLCKVWDVKSPPPLDSLCGHDDEHLIRKATS